MICLRASVCVEMVQVSGTDFSNCVYTSSKNTSLETCIFLFCCILYSLRTPSILLTFHVHRYDPAPAHCRHTLNSLPAKCENGDNEKKKYSPIKFIESVASVLLIISFRFYGFIQQYKMPITIIIE